MKLNAVGTKKNSRSTAYAGARNHIGWVLRAMRGRRPAGRCAAGAPAGVRQSIVKVIGSETGGAGGLRELGELVLGRLGDLVRVHRAGDHVGQVDVEVRVGDGEG